MDFRRLLDRLVEGIAFVYSVGIILLAITTVIVVPQPLGFPRPAMCQPLLGHGGWSVTGTAEKLI